MVAVFTATMFFLSCGAMHTQAADLSVPHGFALEKISHVDGARELVALPNGDLLVATTGTIVAIVPHAAANSPGTTHVFTTIDDAPDAGITFSRRRNAIYVGTQQGVYEIPYKTGLQSTSSSQKIISVRTGPIAPKSDGDVHRTTSVAYTDRNDILYVSIGSSCNACLETDSTRASIFQRNRDGRFTKHAMRIRNAIALAIDPDTGHLWAGDAGQDSLPAGHPYEFLDDVSLHRGIADYGWPECEENHVVYMSGANCKNAVIPLVEFPAYATLIGDVFYPKHPSGRYAFPAHYRSGIFVTRHGAWHASNGCSVVPEVDFVPMHGDTPAIPVDWKNATRQWESFITGFQSGCSASSRTGRPTGIAVAPDGSLFVADDASGDIYRIRPK